MSYFPPNLIDIVNNRIELFGIPEAMYNHLYPIPEGKENFIKWNFPRGYDY